MIRRVDGKEIISMPQRRLSFDCKISKPVFSQQSDVISHTTSRDDIEKVLLDYTAFCLSVVRQKGDMKNAVGRTEASGFLQCISLICSAQHWLWSRSLASDLSDSQHIHGSICCLVLLSCRDQIESARSRQTRTSQIRFTLNTLQVREAKQTAWKVLKQYWTSHRLE